MSLIGVVVIGRNEGQRLVRCLEAVRPSGATVVYVDSGSTDGSVARAQALGAHVLELDPAQPFTAARARNAGFLRLRQLLPQVTLVQFIDGDCELDLDWLCRAQAVLAEHPKAVAVCGRLREREPEASIYNRLCDMDWHRATGPTEYCGGIFMARAQAFCDAGGFDAQMTAGEEAELCLRWRQEGWIILRVEDPMARHDAAMHHFGQWWRRAIRGGQGDVEGLLRHGRGPARHRRRQVLSMLAWGVAAPALGVTLLLAAPRWPALWWPLALLVLAYATVLGRVYAFRRRMDDPPRHALLFAAFCVLGKLPSAIGVLRYGLRQCRGLPTTLIEYK